MSDEDLRAAERAATASGAQDDIAKLKHARCRAGACCAHNTLEPLPLRPQIIRLDFISSLVGDHEMEARGTIYVRGGGAALHATMLGMRDRAGIILPNEIDMGTDHTTMRIHGGPGSFPLHPSRAAEAARQRSAQRQPRRRGDGAAWGPG